MSNKALLTEADLISALKKSGVATKEDIVKLEQDLQKLERRLKRRMGSDRNKILQTIGNLATHTPTLTSFNELKAKVDRLLSTS